MRNIVIVSLVLCLSALATVAGDKIKCDDIRYSAVGIQDDPAGIFRGSLTVEILEPDANGVLLPTGETIDFDFTSTLLGQVDAVSGRTSNTLVSTDGKHTLTSFDEYSTVPLADGGLGLIDVGEIRGGKGRWNCGQTVAGIDPLTGEPLSTIQFYNFETGEPGRADVFVQGRLCRCKTKSD